MEQILAPLWRQSHRGARALELQMQAEPDHAAGNHGAADDTKRLSGCQAVSGGIEYGVVQDIVDVGTQLQTISLSVETCGVSAVTTTLSTVSPTSSAKSTRAF